MPEQDFIVDILFLFLFSDSGGLSGGAVAGVVITVLILVAVAVAFLVYHLKIGNRRPKFPDETPIIIQCKEIDKNSLI